MASSPFSQDLFKENKYNRNTRYEQNRQLCTVEWSDNIETSNSSPQEYLPKYITRFSSDELIDMFYWHALLEGWENMTYDNFFGSSDFLVQ
jgi:hypothetical protein